MDAEDGKSIERFVVRLPEDMHAALKAAAVQNHRSLNGEILARLGSTLKADNVSQKIKRSVRSDYGNSEQAFNVMKIVIGELEKAMLEIRDSITTAPEDRSKD